MRKRSRRTPFRGIRKVRGAIAIAALAGSAAVVLMAGAVAGQDRPLVAGDVEARLGGQFQLQARTSSCAGFPVREDSACEAQAPGIEWFVRRARLTLDVRIADWIEGRVQPAFDALNRTVLKDAWGRLLLNPALRVTMGNFKRPFDGFQMTSSARILTIERDLDVPGVPGLRAASTDELTTAFLLSDRDVGIMLDGVTRDGGFRYWFGLFNGTGPETNADVNTEKQFVGRGQLSVDLAGLPVRLAAAGALTDVPYVRPTGQLAARYFGAGELWAEVGDFGDGPHVQAGVVAGRNPLQNRLGNPVDLAAGETFAPMWTFQAIGAYRFTPAEPVAFWVEAVEPVFRVTHANPNTAVAGDETWGLTPGVQIFFEGQNKLVFNWDVVVFTAADVRIAHSLKAQYQLHF